MRSARIHFIAFFTWVLVSIASPAIIATAQDTEKQKPGTAVDTWRQSLPPEAEAPGETEIPGVATSQPSNDEIEKNLLLLERLWMDSVKAGDADTLGQIISSEFTLVSPRATDITDRNQYFESALREIKLASYEFEKTTVRLFGRTAIVSGRLKTKTVSKGTDAAGNYLITDVWINRGGNWRVVSRHESPLQDQK